MRICTAICCAAILLPGLTSAAPPEPDPAEMPLIWVSPLYTMQPGDKSTRFAPNVSPAREENGIRYITAEDRVFKLLCDLPMGSVLGDYIFSFRFRPHTAKWELRSSQRCLNGGSRRYRHDTLFQLNLSITPSRFKVTADYVKEGWSNTRHRVSEPREIGADLPPYPTIQPGTYPLPDGLWNPTGQWNTIRLTLDQSLLLLEINGKEAARHAVNPAAGSMNLNYFPEPGKRGRADFADFEIREIRPAFDPYQEENLQVRKVIREALKKRSNP